MGKTPSPAETLLASVSNIERLLAGAAERMAATLPTYDYEEGYEVSNTTVTAHGKSRNHRRIETLVASLDNGPGTFYVGNSPLLHLPQGLTVIPKLCRTVRAGDACRIVSDANVPAGAMTLLISTEVVPAATGRIE